MIFNKIITEDLEQIIEENNGLKELYDQTIMVTGASGLIGSYFINTFIELNENYGANIKIMPLVRNLSKISKEIIDKDYIIPIVQDITKTIEYDGDVDYIIHAASPASPPLMREMPVETNLANTVGTANALMFAKEHNTKKFLFISSREVYGQSISNEKYFKEDDLGVINQLIPRNSYAESKKAAENLCLGFNEEYGLDTKIVRLGQTFGPGMNINGGMVHTEFLKMLLNDENIVLKSDGSSIRIYTYISDAVSAMFKIILNSADIVYNAVNNKNEVSIKELAEIIVNLCPEKKSKVVFDIEEEKEGYDYATFKFCLVSSEKIRDELGWNPKYSIDEGFKRTIDYFKINNSH
ncbi:NAD-dependent epimerase/dehydratase family protein [Methanobrevibacter sp.]|uniref:NAD-dependent epimerase/dehydratase family protein n=1 Tax=Methanobrevibacter sp. TaxID=66852 RepID=UPI003890D84E